MPTPRGINVAWFAIVIATAALIATGCGSSSKAGDDDLARGFDAAAHPLAGETPAHLYLYYPDAEVYFAPDRDLYFWRSAGFWGVGQHLPSNYRLGGAPAPLLLLQTDKPYRMHERVAAAFPKRQVTGAVAPGSSLAGVGDSEPWY